MVRSATAVRFVGVRGTDVHGYRSPDFLPAAVFGHEWSGSSTETKVLVDPRG